MSETVKQICKTRNPSQVKVKGHMVEISENRSSWIFSYVSLAREDPFKFWKSPTL